MDATDESARGGFHWLAQLAVRRPFVLIGAWIVLAGSLALLFPTIDQMVRERPVAILPADAPVVVATEKMTAAFQEPTTDNVVVVLLTRDDGLRPTDEAAYRSVADALRKDTANVVMVQDFMDRPALRSVMASKDGNAWYLVAGLVGDLGSPQSYEAHKNIVADVDKAIDTDPGLKVQVTGPAATAGDLIEIGEGTVHIIEIATAVMVLTILLIVYRNPVTMLLPLVMIGFSLLVSKQAVAALADAGMGITNEVVVFMTGMIFGAGTDYAVFLISRYHEYLRQGISSDQAVVRALTSIGKVIGASAATVAVTFVCMSFAKLQLFATVGPALSISIAIAFLAAITLLPALLVLAGRKGWVKPRADLTTRFWRKSGVHIVRRPKTHLAASMAVLLALASCAALVRFNFDDRQNLPDWAPSNIGYTALDKHFSLNATIPQYLYIESPNDLRSPKALADLEQMAARVSQLPDISRVRGITRPTGESLEEAKTSFQAGEVGTKLGDASTQINDRTADLDRLAGGAHELATNLTEIRGGVGEAIYAVRGLSAALDAMNNQYGGSSTLDQFDSAAVLLRSMRNLGAAVNGSAADLSDSFQWAGPVVSALNSSPVCDADPSCSQSRAQLTKLNDARNDGTLDSISHLGNQLESTNGGQTLEQTSAELRKSVDEANAALDSLGADDPNGIQGRLANLQQGADDLSDASRQVADGVQLLVDETKEMGQGLTDASSFLLAMKRDAADTPMSGFYIAPQILENGDFKDAAQLFVSPDGHSVRYMVQTALDPFGPEAMDQVSEVIKTAQSAQPNTTLAEANISMVGYPATLRDIRTYYDHDLMFMIIVTLLVVGLILVALLRALVAPLYLIGSVIVSYFSALGVGVIVFQLIGGEPLSWSVPAMAFIVLVAVGADYNMLLISRIRDESPHGIRSGVIKTVGTTGGVITSAGVIFAASMFGLLFGSVTTMVQAGFIIGMGLLIDTFIVRTITVPSTAVLVGKHNWWPSGWKART